MLCTTVYVSAYIYVLLVLYMSPIIFSWTYTTMCVPLLYTCPPSAVYVFVYYYICVLILYVSYYVCVFLYICPTTIEVGHTTIYSITFLYICPTSSMCLLIYYLSACYIYALLYVCSSYAICVLSLVLAYMRVLSLRYSLYLH